LAADSPAPQARPSLLVGVAGLSRLLRCGLLWQKRLPVRGRFVNEQQPSDRRRKRRTARAGVLSSCQQIVLGPSRPRGHAFYSASKKSPKGPIQKNSAQKIRTCKVFWALCHPKIPNAPGVAAQSFTAEEGLRWLSSLSWLAPLLLVRPVASASRPAMEGVAPPGVNHPTPSAFRT